MYRVIMRPPENEEQTFEGTELDASGKEVKVTRERIRDMTISVDSKDAARLVAERQSFDVAMQEHQAELTEKVGSKKLSQDKAAEQWNDVEAVTARQWRVDLIEKE